MQAQKNKVDLPANYALLVATTDTNSSDLPSSGKQSRPPFILLLQPDSHRSQRPRKSKQASKLSNGLIVWSYHLLPHGRREVTGNPETNQAHYVTNQRQLGVVRVHALLLALCHQASGESIADKQKDCPRPTLACHLIDPGPGYGPFRNYL